MIKDDVQKINGDIQFLKDINSQLKDSLEMSIKKRESLKLKKDVENLRGSLFRILKRIQRDDGWDVRRFKKFDLEVLNHLRISIDCLDHEFIDSGIYKND